MLIKTKFEGYARDGVRLYPMDGGGSSAPAPSSSTVTQTSIPEYAKPYVEKMLGQTEALAGTPYQTYDRERIAGFNPMQEQAFRGAGGMQPSQLGGFGGQLAGAATLGALGTQYDPTQFQGGQFGQQDAQQYMSPYMQSVVDIQQREAQRQGDIAGTQRAAQATQSGAFGGGRQAIMEAEAARNLATQKGDIQAQGLQSAYQQAQAQFNADQARRMQAQQLQEQSKQYGAGLGLQGLQTALSGAGQMGALGQQQFGQGMDINKLQAGYGQQQQQQQQNIMGQQYQDFLNQQNYPYKQLGFMSDMLRGLPLSQSSQQMYQQQPSALTQVAGLAPVAYGVSRMAGMAEGGITGDANVSSILSKLSDPQLEQAKQQARQNRDEERVKEIEDIQRERASARAGISAAAPQQEQQGGIASAASDSMMDRMLPTEAAMARGGIVAFAEPTADNNFSLVTDPQFGGSLEAVSDIPKKSQAEVAAIADALRAKGETIGLAQIRDIESGRLSAPEGFVAPATKTAAAPPEGLTSPVAQAALPPDISAMGARGTAGVGAGAGGVGGGQDFEKLYDTILTKTKKSNQADPYAAETATLGEMGVQREREKKAALEAEQAKFGKAFEGQEARIGKREAAIAARADMNTNLALISFGATVLSTPGGLATALGKGALVGTEQFARGLDKIEQAKALTDKARDDLENLKLNRAEMSSREIRMANDSISGAQLKAKELTLTGLKEAGADTKDKAKMIYESTVKQQLAREAQAAAARTAASTADKPGETERMMAQLGAIQSGKASFAGKTGAEGAKAYQESLGQIGAGKYGARYTGPAPKPAAYSVEDTETLKNLGATRSFLATKSDEASRTKLARIEAEIARIKKPYGGVGGAGGALPSSVSADGQTYPRPANFTDAQWRAYIQSVGAS